MLNNPVTSLDQVLKNFSTRISESEIFKNLDQIIFIESRSSEEENGDQKILPQKADFKGVMIKEGDMIKI